MTRLTFGVAGGSAVAAPSRELPKPTAGSEECNTPVYKSHLEINISVLVYDSVNIFQARNNAFWIIKV